MKGQSSGNLVGFGIGLVVLAVVLIMGGAMVVLTGNTVSNIVGSNNTIMSGLVSNVGSTLTTFTSLLPVLGLAAVVAVAIAYVAGIMGGGGSKK